MVFGIRSSDFDLSILGQSPNTEAQRPEIKIMAEKIVVKAEKREELGKNANRRLRVAGKIPVVIYGGGTESVAAAADIKDLAAILRTDAGVNTVFSLDVDGDVNDVIFQDRQIDPIQGRLIHADLRRFAKGEKIEMTVPVHLVGEPSAPLEDGAVLTQALREIKVLCEPAKTPDAIELDVTDMTAEKSLHVSDIKVGAGVELLDDPETVVASISVVKEVEAETAEAPAEGEAEQAETPAEEPAE